VHIKIVKTNSTPQINIKMPFPYVSSENLGVKSSYKVLDNSDLMYPIAACSFELINLTRPSGLINIELPAKLQFRTRGKTTFHWVW